MDINQLFNKIKEREIKLHNIEKYVDRSTAVNLRRRAIEALTNTSLKNLGKFSISPDNAKKNIENMIGAVQIPLGVAGPLKVNGEYAKEEYYIPLATTEGALVASANRGCSVITLSGGANARIFKDGMTRAPVFRVRNVVQAKRVLEWLKDTNNFNKIKELAESTTKFGELKEIESYVVGNNVFLRFIYDTKDAMGMNMATIATDACMDYIEKKLDIKLISLSGNVCTDKKPSAINAILGRGKTVSADVIISKEIVEEKLKTTPENIVEVNYRKNFIGSAKSGSLGFNAQVANLISAIFIATGQDTAQVVEASNAITSAEIIGNGDLYFSVTLPSLQVGTVGGGTHLNTQYEALSMLGVAGSGEVAGNNSKKFAEIVASAVLAGEISLLGAQAARHLAKAHLRLAR
ncbi:MAG TPA: hydroxymethylglutaryl-CoA reductase (NADPH) [Methanosarcinales archaeon]|nr:hydroxymethylglutaryl-CoA reductase (NADPH) [Methanosarcinales archaeon]